MATAPTAAPEAAPDPAVAKAAAKAREVQLKQWRRQYGEGPYPDEIDAYLALKPVPLRPLYRTLYTGGERNAVLNFQRLGLAAMEVGAWSDAERAFDGALLRIEAVYAKNAEAERARSLFAKEANKAYNGEPYERAMAYYYRGLLYLRKGDYENARAVFKQAEYQDTVSDQEEFQSDFAAMNYLAGWASQCNGQQSMADESYAAATKAKAGLALPMTGANLLMIAETGRGPQKVRDGTQREKMTFSASTDAPESAVVWQLAPKTGEALTFEALPVSSVYEQATTRGGRAIDGILAGKASFKAATGAIGTGAMTAGMAMMQQSNYSGSGAEAGMYMAAAGAVFSMFAAAAKPDADIRNWDTLPDGLVLTTAKVEGGDWTPTLTYKANGAPVAVPGTPIMAADGKSCKIMWTRSRTAMPSSFDAPGDDSNVAAAVGRRKDVQVKDKAFRIALSAG